MTLYSYTVRNRNPSSFLYRNCKKFQIPPGFYGKFLFAVISMRLDMIVNMCYPVCSGYDQHGIFRNIKPGDLVISMLPFAIPIDISISFFPSRPSKLKLFSRCITRKNCLKHSKNFRNIVDKILIAI